MIKEALLAEILRLSPAERIELSGASDLSRLLQHLLHLQRVKGGSIRVGKVRPQQWPFL